MAKRTRKAITVAAGVALVAASAAVAFASIPDYAVDDAKDQIPVSLVGLYEVGGFHRGEGGDCEGSVMILLEGNPLTTPVGAGSAAGAVLALVGVLSAGRVQA